MSLSVNAVLFGESDAAASLSRSRGWSGVIRGIGGAVAALSPGSAAVVQRELSSSLVSLLTMDVGDLLVSGWRTHRGLTAAAEATAAAPGSSEVVQMAAHRITTAHRPYLEVSLNGNRVATVHCELSLVFDLDVATGTVREGRLVDIQCGRCLVTGGLSCEGHELASRQVTIDPAVTVRLGSGIPLRHGAGAPS
jgi:hypothetical protein